MTTGKMKLSLGAACMVALLAGCEGRSGSSSDPVDAGFDGGRLKDGVAALWVDPDGCQHWYIDDGIEGFMTPRLNRDGTPRCEMGEDRRQTSYAKDGTTILLEPEPIAPAN